MIPFRIKDSLQQRQLKFLKEMITYYSEDVNRRAVDDRTSSCYYLDKNTGNKCAIGRYIIDENSLDYSGTYSNLIKTYPNCIPKEIKNLGNMFLSAVQNLHDHSHLWSKNGLNDIGKEKVKELVYNIKNKIYDDRKLKKLILLKKEKVTTDYHGISLKKIPENCDSIFINYWSVGRLGETKITFEIKYYKEEIESDEDFEKRKEELKEKYYQEYLKKLKELENDK